MNNGIDNMNKKLRNIVIGGLALLVVAVSCFGQAGIDRMVNAYSLVTVTWSSFTVTDLTVNDDLGVTDDLTVDGNASLNGDTSVDANLTVTGTITHGGAQATAFSGILTTNITVDFGACGTNETVTVAVTLPGATTNCAVAFNLPEAHTSFRYNAFATAANTVTVSASNISITNAINQAAMPARITVIKY